MCPRSNFNNFPRFFIAFYSRLDLESHVRLEHADLAKKRIIRIGNFYRADTVLFFRREKSRSSEKWKNGFETFDFFDVPKISHFSRKTNADATTFGSGPGRVPLQTPRTMAIPLGETMFPLGEIMFPWGRIMFPSGKIMFLSGEIMLLLGEIMFPLGEIMFPWGENMFPFREIMFPLGEIMVPWSEFAFLLGEIKFPLGKMKFPFRWTHVSFSEKACMKWNQMGSMNASKTFGMRA